MENLLRPFQSNGEWSARPIILNAVDILLVAYILYRILVLVRGPRAWKIFVGMLLFGLLYVLSDRLGLAALHWLLDKATYLLPAGLVIFFLPELKQFLEGVGTIPGRLVPVTPSVAEDRAEAHTIEELVAAATELATGRVGALIVIEKTSKLDDIAANGVALNASVSAPLLGAVFYEGNPLHDGAVIVRGDRLLAAACRLPLSDSSRLDHNLHMRHRAAVGVSEVFDCLVIVVSEERGTISVAEDGRIRRCENSQELSVLLNRELRHIERTSERAKRIRAKRQQRQSERNSPKPSEDHS